MKFTNIENNLGNIIIGALNAFMILCILFILGVFGWVDLTQGVPMISFLWFIFIPCFGLAINWFLGRFFGDKHYNTGIVHEGRTMWAVERTPVYYTRRMVLCIVEMVLFVAVGLRFILWLFDAEYMGFGIAGIVCSVIAMVICFIMVMSSYEQSSLRVKKDTETTE